jgi:hypothetical protein
MIAVITNGAADSIRICFFSIGEEFRGKDFLDELTERPGDDRGSFLRMSCNPCVQVNQVASARSLALAARSFQWLYRLEPRIINQSSMPKGKHEFL